MPTETITRYLTSKKTAKNIQMNLVMQCAPVLKNVKMSCLFTMPARCCDRIAFHLRRTGVRFCCMRRGNERELIFLYREEWLKSYLEQEDVTAFLNRYGYTEGSLDQKLQHLREQISYFYCKSQGFPHEMGVFLGYPLEDVVGFIEHQGRNCSYIGYWKVYSDVERAKRMFCAFDEAKDCAVNEFFSGKNIREIAC
ncbi:MAG: DUF3793 family protein [Clostridiales bacterium]|nr:DUF3793 family protein [Clostridiales bacterium]